MEIISAVVDAMPDSVLAILKLIPSRVLKWFVTFLVITQLSTLMEEVKDTGSIRTLDFSGAIRKIEEIAADPTVLSTASPIKSSYSSLSTLPFNKEVFKDYRNCTSPEYGKAPWPLKGDIPSLTTKSSTCGFYEADSNFAKYARSNVKRQLRPLLEACQQLVVYGAALEHGQIDLLENSYKRHPILAENLVAKHNRCFFMFVPESEVRETKSTSKESSEENGTSKSGGMDPFLIGQHWVVPIPDWVFPYQHPRRNTKLFQYAGPLLFPAADTIIWQDIIFSTGAMDWKQPKNYFDMIHDDTCVTTMGLPVHEWTTLRRRHRAIQSQEYAMEAPLLQSHNKFKDHCKYLMEGGTKNEKLNVTNTDSIQSVDDQCEAYLQHAWRRPDTNIDFLDQGMADFDFVIWNQGSKSCQDFNAQLQCTILDQIHCHSDQDRLAIPFAFYHMGLTGYYDNGKAIDENWDPQYNDLDMVLTNDVMKSKNKLGIGIDLATKVRVVRNSCHWYFPIVLGDGNVCSIWNDKIDVKKSQPFEVVDPFLENTPKDYSKCTSPEYNIPWPLAGDSSSKLSSFSCGINTATTFGEYFQETVWKKQIKPLTAQCSKLAVFGVGFGAQFLQDIDSPKNMKRNNSTQLISQHNHCFFMFVSTEDMPKFSTDPLFVGHTWLIPLPAAIMPYQNPRRNAKLMKYMGQLLFRGIEVIVWQDAKFFRHDLSWKLPKNYDDVAQKDACVTMIGLPVHGNTVGKNHPAVSAGLSKAEDKYKSHCRTILVALSRRPNITDSPDSLMAQCQAYIHKINEKGESLEVLDNGLIDSAFIIWNESTKQCRKFNAALRCTIMDQLHCHSDRDQVPIPFAIYSMHLEPLYVSPRRNFKPVPVDDKYDPQINDLDFYAKNSKSGKVDVRSTPMIRIVRYNCHWYNNRIGQGGCKFWEKSSRY